MGLGRRLVYCCMRGYRSRCGPSPEGLCRGWNFGLSLHLARLFSLKFCPQAITQTLDGRAFTRILRLMDHWLVQHGFVFCLAVP
jgi:hypothetical protein